MIGTALPSMALPRSRSLTDALIAPAESRVSRSELGEVRRRLEDGLQESAGSLGIHQRVRIDAYRLRFHASESSRPDVFAWSPRTARRPIALEGVRGWLANKRMTPMQAVAEAVERLTRPTDEWRGAGGSLGTWIASLRLGAKSTVQAEAVTLATQLIGAIDWPRLTHPFVGDDRSISFASVPQIVLRGRIEVRSPIPLGSLQDGYPAGSAVFAVMTGRPTSTARHELGLAALTVALDPKLGPAIRVIGWWPQCGRALVLPVDGQLLETTVDAILATLRSPTATSAGLPRPSGRWVTGTRDAAARTTAGDVAIAS